ncbi:MAG: transposase [Rhodoferax sp.]|nr:transposase [Rhodoferax sp.]MCF8210376.1 transposase [Rhodoferax sp.]
MTGKAQIFPNRHRSPEAAPQKKGRQSRSCCSSPTGPQGLEGLKVRTWTCSVCGSLHDRDTNSAINILKRGVQARVAQESATVGEMRVCEATANKTARRLVVEAGHGLPVEGIPLL